MPPLARRPPLHPAAPPRLRVARHRGPAAADQLPPAPAARRALLPLPPAAHARGRRKLAAAALRPGGQPQSLRRQGRAPAARRAPRLLLLHAHALRLAPARRLPRRPRARAAGAGGGTIARPAPRLGLAHRGARQPFRGHQSGGPAAHRRVLRPAQHGHLPAGRYRLLPHRPRVARGLLPRCVGLRPLQAARPGDPGVREARPAAGRHRQRPGRGPPPVPGESARALPRLAAGRGRARAPAALPGALVPRRGGLRHRPRRGDGLRRPGHRLRPRRRLRDGRAARRAARADRPALRGADRRMPGGRDAEAGGDGARLRAGRGPAAGAALQRSPLRRRDVRLPGRRAAARGPAAACAARTIGGVTAGAPASAAAARRAGWRWRPGRSACRAASPRSAAIPCRPCGRSHPP